MRFPWECHDQSQETNWRHWTGTAFLSQKKSYTKIRSVYKNALRMGVACSYSSAPGNAYFVVSATMMASSAKISLTSGVNK